jgi:pimeloyl-ACP methyl ester carboxylesterase
MPIRFGSVTLAVALLAAAAPSFADTPAAKPARPQRTIVLVHGAFADGSSWAAVITQLQAKGYDVVAVQEPLSSLADDVAATRRVLDAQPGEVILVGHSYGGVVISEAGNHPKVVGLVYVAAFGPDAKESITDLGKGQPPPPWAAQLKVDSAGFASLPTDVVLSSFAQDVPPASAKVIAATQKPIAAASFDAKVTTPAWRTKPSWYLLASQDRMIDPKAQTAMSKRMKAKVTTINASHVPMVSQPDKVTAVILDAATSAKVKPAK